MLVKNCLNLRSFIKPLTILDNILTNGINDENVVTEDEEDVKRLKSLFDAHLSGEEYKGNEYIWNIFNAYLNCKDLIAISLYSLNQHCENKKLLELLLSGIEKHGKGEKYSSQKYEDKNLLKPEIVSMFQNVSYLGIITDGPYPVSLKSVLSLINGTKIKKVTVQDWDGNWLPEAETDPSFTEISNKYKQANWKLKFEKRELAITYNK